MDLTKLKKDLKFYHDYDDETIDDLLSHVVSEEDMIGYVVDFLEEEYIALCTMFEAKVPEMETYIKSTIRERLSHMSPSFIDDRFYCTGLTLLQELDDTCKAFQRHYFIFDEATCEFDELNTLTDNICSYSDVAQAIRERVRKFK